MPVNVWWRTVVTLLMDRSIFGSRDLPERWTGSPFVDNSIELTGWSCRSARRCVWTARDKTDSIWECQGLQDVIKCLWILKNRALQMDVGGGKWAGRVTGLKTQMWQLALPSFSCLAWYVASCCTGLGLADCRRKVTWRRHHTHLLSL